MEKQLILKFRIEILETKLSPWDGIENSNHLPPEMELFRLYK